MTPRRPRRTAPPSVAPATREPRQLETGLPADGTRSFQVVTRAKVNLSLEVIRRREDGFHEIETLFQCIDLADRIHIEFNEDRHIEIACDAPGIPTDETNLCHRALVAMRHFAGPGLGARIRLEKRIPAGAGLGGGSANAAGILRVVQQAFRLDIPAATLQKTAAALGSDVPFLLHGGTAIGRGKGEILTPLTPLKRGFFVVVKPEVSIPTAWVYSGFNFRLTSHRPRLNLSTANSVLTRFPRGRLPFRNALEDVVLPAYPAVARLLEELQDDRPCFASMTGSGSAVFAIFEHQADADQVAKRFSVRGLFASVAKPAKQAIDIR